MSLLTFCLLYMISGIVLNVSYLIQVSNYELFNIKVFNKEVFNNVNKVICSYKRISYFANSRRSS